MATQRVAASGDDIHRSGRLRSQTFFSTTQGWHQFPEQSDGNENDMGYRFQVNVAQGAIIANAKLTVTAKQTTSGSNANATLLGHDSDNSGQITTYTDFDDKLINQATSATVAWNSIASFTAESTYDSPDITSILQEIVDRPGWSSGNYITIFIKYNTSTDGSYREIYTYDTTPSKAVLLTYNVSSDVTTTQTITGKARMQTVGTQIITGKSRLQTSVSRTIAGLSRITASVSRTITGISDILKATAQTITGISRINIGSNQTITGISRILTSTSRTITGIANISATTLRTITGLSRIEDQGTQTITGTSRIQTTTTQTIAGISSIATNAEQTITGKGNILTTTSRTIAGKGNIKTSSTQTITGKSRIVGVTEIKVVNNLIVDSDRETYISPIYDTVAGIEYYPFESKTSGMGYFELGDRITVSDREGNSFEVVIFEIELVLEGGFREMLKAKVPDKTYNKYNFAGVVGKRIQNTEIVVDKQQGQIDILSGVISEGWGIPQQAEPPNDPEINDLWVDTDDGILYIWDGSTWQPTDIDPTFITDYYTKDETNAQITVTADGINSSVSAVRETAQSAKTASDTNAETITDIQSQITTIQQDIDSVEIDITRTGGVNLLLNSSGLKEDVTDWQVLDTDGNPVDARNDATIDQSSDTEENTESGSCIKLVDQFITQTVKTIPGNVYTFYTRFKKTTTMELMISGITDPVEITAGGYSSGTWAVFSYQFTATAPTTTITIETTSSYGQVGDMVLKIGNVTGWVQAPNEVYGKGFKFDKDGFTLTDPNSKFKAILDNQSLTVYDTSSGTDRIVMRVSKDEGKISKLIVQDEFTLRRYENPEKALRMLPTATGAVLVIND